MTVRRHDLASTLAPPVPPLLGPWVAVPFGVIVEPVTGRLELVGELDLAGRGRVRVAGVELLAGRLTEVVVDVARLRFIDAGGIGLLVGLSNRLAARGCTMRIVRPQPRVGRIFVLCGLGEMLRPPQPRDRAAGQVSGLATVSRTTESSSAASACLLRGMMR